MTHARTASMANVMGYLYFRINLFISVHLHDWRHVVLAVEDSTARQLRLAHAARRRMPLPGWPHLKVVLQPLTVVVMAFTTAFITIFAVRNASTPPTMIPCTT